MLTLEQALGHTPECYRHALIEAVKSLEDADLYETGIHRTARELLDINEYQISNKCLEVECGEAYRWPNNPELVAFAYAEKEGIEFEERHQHFDPHNACYEMSEWAQQESNRLFGIVCELFMEFFETFPTHLQYMLKGEYGYGRTN